MRRIFLVLILLLLLAVGAVSAQDGPSGELVIALPSDPTSLFFPRGADITAGNAARPLYDSLVNIDENNELQPALATEWEIGEDGLTYTFTLRQGVVFHNGEPFNADSVFATWEFGKDPSNDYAQNYALVSEIEVVDEYTVILRTEQPSPIFMTVVANEWAMIPPAYMAEVGIEGFEAAPVGTGPFRFVDRVPGDRIIYEANTDYWQEGLPLVERVTFRIIPDSTTRVAAVQTGEVDIVNRLSPDEIMLLEGSDAVNIINYPNDRVYYLAFKNIGNGVGTPLEDVRVRQALNYAVNRPGIIEAIFSGEASLVTGFVLSTNLGFDDSLSPYPYDPDQARALLAEAGYADGFSISMGCPTDAYLNINEVCLSIQRDLSQVGIDVSVEFKTSNTFWSEPGYGAVGPMFVDSWSTNLGEAINRLEGALIPGNYYTAWEDDDLTALIEQIQTTVDREARAQLYVELQQMMYENPPFVYLYQPFNFEAATARVQGYMPQPNEGYDLTRVSVSG